MREEELLNRGVFRKEAIGYGCSVCFVCRFLADRPVRAAVIFRVEDPVAALLAKELLNVFPVGIEDDCDLIFPGFNLIKDLPNERAFAGSGITGDLDVMRFFLASYAEVLAGIPGHQELEQVAPVLQSKRKTAAACFPVEAIAADQGRTAKQESLARSAELMAV